MKPLVLKLCVPYRALVSIVSQKQQNEEHRAAPFIHTTTQSPPTSALRFYNRSPFVYALPILILTRPTFDRPLPHKVPYQQRGQRLTG
ncbi:unnamed protein product [Boreogadus saida]